MKTQIVCLALALAACQAPLVKHPYSPTYAADSTFRVEAYGSITGFDEELLWVGSGWIERNDGSFSHLVTAGHVCNTEHQDFGVTVSFKLRDRFGNAYPVVVEKISDKYDLCEMVAPRLGEPLELAAEMPKYDEPIMMVGAPHGLWGCDNIITDESFECGMAPISRGSYAGGTLVSIPSTHGYSGSAVFTPLGVIGVLVAGYDGYDSMSFIEPLDHIKEFLAD